VNAAPEPAPRRASSFLDTSIGRLVAAAAILAIGLVALWQAGIIFSSDDPVVTDGDTTTHLQPADASIDTQAPASRDVGLDQGDIAPDFEFSAFDGQRLKLSDFRGRPVFLNFWATWCQPCKRELPDMDELLREYSDEGLAVIAVNNGERFEPARKFMEEDMGVNLTAIGYDPEQDIVSRYNVVGMPTSFFIDANGVITQVVRGELRRTDMQANIELAIDGAP
jgi:thiol-disulfide isomerase/thioredoxin